MVRSLFAPTQPADSAWWILRVALGGMAIVSGLDKFFHLLVDWTQYLWRWVPDLLNVSPDAFMYAVGVIEIAVGIGIFTSATRVFAFVLSAWLLAIAMNLVITGYFDIAARDVGLSVAAFTLGVLSPTPERQAKRRRAGTPA